MAERKFHVEIDEMSIYYEKFNRILRTNFEET